MNLHKYTPSFWNNFFEKEHYFKGSVFLEELKFSGYLSYLKNIKLKNSFLLKTDLYVEAKDKKDNYLPFLTLDRGIGMDIALETVRSAKKNLSQAFPHMKFVVADVRHLPFRSETFDAVISDSTLDQIPRQDLVSALAETRRVVVPKGLLILSLNNLFNYPMAISHSIKNIFLRNYYVCFSYRARHILSLLGQLGFRVIHWDYIVPLECLGLFLIRLADRIKIITPATKAWLRVAARISKLPFLKSFCCLQFIITTQKK